MYILMKIWPMFSLSANGISMHYLKLLKKLIRLTFSILRLTFSILLSLCIRSIK